MEETSFYPFGFPRHRKTNLERSDPYQFTQKELDRESGLNSLDARYQSPILGRFLRVDPLSVALKSSWLEEPQRLNLYAYCANAPLGYSDPERNGSGSGRSRDLASAWPKAFGRVSPNISIQ